MNLLRAAGLVASALVALWVGMFVAFGTRERLAERPLPPITAAAADRAAAREAASAAALGMAPAEHGDAPIAVAGGLAAWSRTVAIGARECVAVVAAIHGHVAPQALALQTGNEPAPRITYVPAPLALDRAASRVAAQVQWCEAEARTRVVVLEAASIDPLGRPRYAAGTVRWAVHRGTWARAGGLHRLTRGVRSSEALRALGDGPALEEARPFLPAGGTALGAPVDLTMSGARLLPADAATYRALWQASAGDGGVPVNPRLDPRGIPLDLGDITRALADGARLPAVHDPVVAREHGGFRRVLAVIDRGRLGARCVALSFTRLLYAHHTEVHRWDPGTARFTELPHQENVATDRACPAEGTMAYVVPDTDQERHRMQVWALPDTLPP